MGFLQDGRLAFIDGWRVIAVTIVVFTHLVLFSPHFAAFFGVSRDLAVALGGYGGVAVDIFFFVSGFVVSKTCIEEADANGDFSVSGFYIRRLCRIAPPLLLYVFGCTVLGTVGVIDFTARDFLGAFWLCNTNLPFVTCDVHTVGHTWSLAFEEQFYLCFPILFSIVEIRPSVRRLGGLACTLPVWLLPFVFSWNWIGKTGFVLVYSLFFAGYLAARYRRPLSRLANSSWVPVAGVVAAILVFYPGFLSHTLLVWKFYKFVYVAAIPVMVLSTGYGLVHRVLSFPRLAHVGRASYSIYLWQQLFVTGSSSRLPLSLQLIGVAGMVLGCVVLFDTVERRLIRRGKKISEQIRLGAIGGSADCVSQVVLSAD